MSVLSVKGHRILAGFGHRNSSTYRSIMEMLARFGYASIREVTYDQKISLRTAINRLWYLQSAGLIQRFESQTVPTEFYCLTADGRQAVRNFNISVEISGFTPRQYNLIYQQHDRLLIKTFSALRRIFGPAFLGMVSEHQLKREAGGKRQRHGGKRVLDGEFKLQVTKSQMESAQPGSPVAKQSIEEWRGGLELELSLKTPKRYRRQFEDLGAEIFDAKSGQSLTRLVLFLYTNETVVDRLSKHVVDLKEHFRGVPFYFAQLDRFLDQLGEAPVKRIVGGEVRMVKARDMAELKILVRETRGAGE